MRRSAQRFGVLPKAASNVYFYKKKQSLTNMPSAKAMKECGQREAMNKAISYARYHNITSSELGCG